jgi:hypothetical protein
METNSDIDYYRRERTLLSEDCKKSLERLEQICGANIKKFKKIFLKCGKGANPVLDPNRMQCSFAALRLALRHEKDRQEFDQIISGITATLTKRICVDGMVLSKGNILCSLPNGERQAWHHDFPELKYTATPQVYLLPISRTCRMDICKQLLVHPDLNDVVVNYSLNRGDLFRFHGYLPHRGCSYSKLNFRLHFYSLHKEDEYLMKKIEGHSEIYSDSTTLERKKGRPRKL